MRLLFIYLVLTFIGPLWIIYTRQINFHADWRTAPRESAHLAPIALLTPEAIIQVYAARAFNWRGLFSVHLWIATKAENEKTYTVYQVIGWRKYYGHAPLVITEDIPDRLWFGQKPQIIFDLRGEKAQQLIPQISALARRYPDANDYVFWPGPNSNTFPAYVIRHLPKLHMALPPNAVGKDFLPFGQFIAKAPSGTGWQISCYGIFGLLMAREEGIEINILGLVYGFNFKHRSIILPGIGEIVLMKSKGKIMKEQT